MMMRVMYIGSSRNLYNVEQYCKKNVFDMKSAVNDSINLADMKNEILAYGPQVLFADILSFSENERHICEMLEAIQLAINCRVAIIAADRSMGHKMISGFVSSGFRYFVFASSLGIQTKEIEDVFAGKATLTEDEAEKIIAAREENVQKIFSRLPESETENAMTDKKKIAVTGIMGRIGTTTTALQLVKHLMQQGHSACYIERNDTGFISDLTAAFDGAYISGEKIVYQNTDMYSAYGISDAISADYEYYVYDYGQIRTADIMSILEKDSIMIVCGSSPSELAALTDTYKLMYRYDDPFYIFNLTHTAERDEIRQLQSGKRDKTAFLAYCPDPFLYCSDNGSTFDLVLNGSKTKKSEIKRKRGFFR